LADRLAQQRRAAVRAVGRKAVRGDRLDPERAEQEREHERRRREAVVDDEPEPAGADRLDVQAVEQILRVALAHAGRIADIPDVAEGGAPQLATGEVLLDL